MMKNILFLVLSFYLFLPYIHVCAQNKYIIDITKEGADKFPIAVGIFDTYGEYKTADQAKLKKLNQTFRDRLIELLDHAGLFNLLPASSFISKDMVKIHFPDWKVIGAEGLITGIASLKGNNFSLELRLFDVFKGKQLIGKSYTDFTLDNVDAVAKQFGNLVIGSLTGIKGIFNTKIAFVSDKTGNKEIYLMDMTGKNIEKITNNGKTNMSPVWSPDGRYLTFTSFKQGNPDLFIYDLRLKKDRLLSSFHGLNSAASWHPGQDWIIYSGSLAGSGFTNLFLVRPNGSNRKQLTFGRYIDIEAQYTPNGSKIVFSSTRAGSPHIYIMNADGTNIKRLTYAGYYNAAPVISPNGDKIAFAGSDMNLFDIFIMNLDGTNIERLTIEAMNNEHPSYSPDARQIVFQSTRNTKSKKLLQSDIFIMNADGSNQRQLTKNMGNCIMPAWSKRLD